MKGTKKANRRFALILGVTAFALSVLVSSCQSSAHPDDKAAVYHALDQNSLSSVMIAQDRGSGVITLKGIVGSADQKTKAETVAQQAAPGYTISNQLQVDNAGVMGTAQPNGNTASATTGSSPQK